MHRLPDPNWVVVGQFGRVQGIQGFIKIQSFTEDPPHIFSYQPWYRLEQEKWVKTHCIDKKVQPSILLAKIQDFATRESASSLTHLKIGVQRHVLPPLPPGTFYCFELVGWRVMNIQNKILGTIVQIMSTGANDVLVVEGEKRHLIPYLRDTVIKHIHQTRQTMVVDWDDINAI